MILHLQPARVRDVMSARVRTTLEDQDLETALQEMAWCGIRHLVVIRPDGNVAGVLSQRDVFERMALRTSALALGHPSTAQTVASAMRVPAETIGPDELAATAARSMAGRRLGCMPVVEDGRLVGIVTATDLLAEYGMTAQG